YLEIKVGEKTINLKTWETDDGVTVVHHASLRELAEALEISVGEPRITVTPIRDSYHVTAVVPVTDGEKIHYGVHEAWPENLDGEISSRYPVRMAVTRAEAQAILEFARPILLENGIDRLYADIMMTRKTQGEDSETKGKKKGRERTVP